MARTGIIYYLDELPLQRININATLNNKSIKQYLPAIISLPFNYHIELFRVLRCLNYDLSDELN
jgi:hypothetical protein